MFNLNIYQNQKCLREILPILPLQWKVDNMSQILAVLGIVPKKVQAGACQSGVGLPGFWEEELI